MTPLRWIREDVLFAIHDEQMAEHGGLAGVRDRSLVLSALERPKNLAAYGKPDLADLAAAYANGLLRNHGFFDGNKRTAFVVACLFLLENGYDLIAGDEEVVTVMLRAAEGSLAEAELAAWIRSRIQPLG